MTAVATEAIRSFPDLTEGSRTCRECGRPLAGPLSRMFRIGPKCRRGLSADELAAYFTPPDGPTDD